MRLAVKNRVKFAAVTREQYTDEQFKYWMSCLRAAADMVEDMSVKSGIHRDLELLYDAYGDFGEAIKHYQKSIEILPSTPMRQELNARITELIKNAPTP